jgi:hypothetical protein
MFGRTTGKRSGRGGRQVLFSFNSDSDVARFGEDELLDGDTDGRRGEFVEEQAGDLVGEGFQEAPTSTLTECDQSSCDDMIINRIADFVGGGSPGEVMIQFDREQQALRSRPFGVGHTDTVQNFKVLDPDEIVHAGMDAGSRTGIGAGIGLC